MEDFTLKSTAFKKGMEIPKKHTCDGEDVNPFLEIKTPPEGTISFALIVDDPDATRGGTWDHWLVWNIPAGTQYISEESMPEEVAQGVNSFGRIKYGGPCPPLGGPAHTYRFTIYALDCFLDLLAGSPRVDLERHMAGHILGQAELTGFYKRSDV